MPPLRTNNDSSPEDRYNSYREAKAGLSREMHRFPSDIPEYRLIMVGRDYSIGVNTPWGQANTIATNTLTAGTSVVGYILPLPQMRMVDKYSVEYDESFSFLGAVAKQFNAVTSPTIGVTLNKQRSVLMESPELKRHEFTWKLSPKNENESERIRTIVESLKMHMAPKLPSIAQNLILTFPLIFDVYFDPNFSQMYGFKPCVIQSIEVDYSGGNQVPSLYHNGYPESVILTLLLLEIEFWVFEDYQRWRATTNPVDTLRRPSNIVSGAVNEVSRAVEVSSQGRYRKDISNKSPPSTGSDTGLNNR